METFFLIAVVILFGLIVFEAAKASEYVAFLRGEKEVRKQANKVNGALMIVFLVLGLFGVWYCNKLYWPNNIFSWGAQSVEGKQVDTMIFVTLGITGFVFFLTQILLFTLPYRFQYNEKRKAWYYPYNNTLEIIWTTVPIVTFLTMAVFGLKHWFQINGDAPKNAMVVEITGHQFAWEMRYPGPDGVLGRINYKLINPAKGNPLGIDWNDQASRDDIHVPTTMYVVVNKPTKLVIRSQDVIHDVGIPAFRMKMDAVPGMPTTLFFTPVTTTEEMRKRTGKSDFDYEISCDQLCGIGHFGMRGVIKVVTQKEFDAWMAKQTSAFKKAQEQAMQLSSTEKAEPGSLALNSQN